MGASRLGSLLVREGLLTEQDRNTISKTCGQRSWAFAKGILATGMLDEDELAAFCAEHTRFEVAPRNFIENIDRDILETVDPKVITRLEILPIKIDWEKIQVAVVDPLDIGTLRQLEFFTGLVPDPVIAPISEIYRGIKKLVPDFAPHDTALTSFLGNHANNAWQKQRLEEQITEASATLPSMGYETVQSPIGSEDDNSDYSPLDYANNTKAVSDTESEEFEIDISEDEQIDVDANSIAPEFEQEDVERKNTEKDTAPDITDIDEQITNEPEIDLDEVESEQTEEGFVTKLEQPLSGNIDTQKDEGNKETDYFDKDKQEANIDRRDNSEGYDLFNFSDNLANDKAKKLDHTDETSAEINKEKNFEKTIVSPTENAAIESDKVAMSARINQALIKISLAGEGSKATLIAEDLFKSIWDKGFIVCKEDDGDFSLLIKWGIYDEDMLLLSNKQKEALNERLSESSQKNGKRINLDPDLFQGISTAYLYQQNPKQDFVLIVDAHKLQTSFAALLGNILITLKKLS